MADFGLDQSWPGSRGDQENRWWIETFKDEMFHLAQQKGSKLRNLVRTRIVNGDATYFERLAPSDPVEKSTRHTPTPILDVSHSRRKLTMRDFLWNDLVDAEDKRRMLVDPVGAYTTNAGMSMGRKWDDLILGADHSTPGDPQINDGIIGDAYDYDGSAIAFDTANQEVPAGGAGMTIDKLTEAKYIMDNNDVDESDRIIVIGPKQLQDLLNTTEVTSADYNSVKALVKGDLDTFLGFKFVTMTRLPLDASDGDRVCVAFQKNCVGLGINRDIEIRRDERSDVSYALQVFARFTSNATRVDDAGVVRVVCSEA